MSNATRVPETFELDGDDARQTLAETGTLALLKDSFTRLRAADGFSHARALAFTTSLILVQGMIVVVGAASAFGDARFVRTAITAIETAVPGPAANVLRNAVEQANRVGNDGDYLPLTLGLIGLLVTSTTAMGQFERALNRLYGIEQDRPSLVKYTRAALLAITAGSAIAFAFLVIAFGRGVLSSGVGDGAPVAARDPARRGRSRRAVRLRAEAPAARLAMARVRRRGRGRALDLGDAPARARVPGVLELRRHVRAARRDRRAAALDVPLGLHDPLRRRGHGAARGRPRRRRTSRARRKSASRRRRATSSAGSRRTASSPRRYHRRVAEHDGSLVQRLEEIGAQLAWVRDYL